MYIGDESQAASETAIDPETGAITYRGVALFYVRRGGSGQWRLEFWDEIEPVGNADTWGFLRGRTRERLQ